MDFSYFLELEELSCEYVASGQVLTLNDDQRNKLLRAKFDYEHFRYDFDMTCRFICFLSRLERQNKFYELHVILLKYTFVLSTFLKNRSSTRLSRKNDNFLDKAIDALAADSRIQLSSLPSEVETRYFDSGIILISFALVNIYEIIKGTKASSTYGAAHAFLGNDFSLQAAENSIISYSSRMSDFDIVGEAFDQTIAMKAFKNYNKEDRPIFSEAFESQNLLWFCIYCGAGLVAHIVITEMIIFAMCSE